MSTLRKPRWILAIVVGILLSVWFVRLGFWQLSRLEERRASNALIQARMAEPPRSFEGLVGQYGIDPDALIYRQAIVKGRYLTSEEFFSVGRNYNGVTGTLIMTPLELDNSSIMIIVRGIVPAGTEGPPAKGYEPPLGSVTLTGRLDDGEEPLRIGEPPPDNGKVESLSRVDLAYIDEWSDRDILPVDLLIETQQPTNAQGTPIPIPAPELSEGKHLGYAVQWFAFAVMAFVGGFLLVWQAGTERSKDEASQVQQSHE